MEIEFSDGGYIEGTPSGNVYVGKIANECGHIIRKTGVSLEVFKKVFDKQVTEKVEELYKSNNYTL